MPAQVVTVAVGEHPLLPSLEAKKASPDAAYLVTTSRDEVQVTLAGFEGDRHAGMTLLATGHTPRYPRGTVLRNTRQASVVAAEELDVVAARLGVPELQPEWLGANLCLRGVPSLTALPPGTRLIFDGGAVLVVEGPNQPCVFPGRAIQAGHPEIPGLARAFPAAARDARGVVAWVERAGTIRRGDAVVVESPDRWFGAG